MALGKYISNSTTQAVLGSVVTDETHGSGADSLSDKKGYVLHPH